MKNTSWMLLVLTGLTLAACGSAPPPPPPPIRYAQPTPTCRDQWVHMPMMINFPTGGTEMGYQDREVLRQMVVSASERDDIVRVRVEGHTDTCGGELDNMVLSQSRATAVARELALMNVPPSRIDTIGYGSTRPRAEERCGRNQRLSEQTNRRVEFSLLVCR